ncbi:sensor histidine kinase [Amycolatopsis samaneae]|uniref:Sensor histidine kinase n=1 Tax=Amycolatopsis samaneae TaxID=664691 RepID=A0ABW5GTS7_9PSEU
MLSPALGSDGSEPHLAATAEPRGTASADQRPKLAWYLARAVVTTVFLGHVAVTLTTLERAHLGYLRSTYGVLAVVAVLAIQLFYFSRPATRLNSPTSRVMLAIEAFLVYVPIFTFGEVWTGLPSFLAGSVLLVFRPRVGWPLFAAVLLSKSLLQLHFGSGALDAVYTAVAGAAFGLDVYLMSRLARMITDLHAARSELAQRAVAEQRLRFARDLHDLLGLSLSAIALKGELVHRLIHRSIDQAQRELSEITGVAQRTLSDVRAVARGYREVSLANEFRAAESLLRASDIAVRVHIDQSALPVQARTTLAKVLRAGVTDVLRRGEVDSCEISVRKRRDQVSLDIVSDGVRDEEPDAESEYDSLVRELESLGGKVSAGKDGDGRYRFHVELPLPEELGPDDEAASGERRDLDRGDTRQVRALLTATFCTVTLAVELRVLTVTREAWQILLITGYLAALLTLQLSYFSRPTTRLRSPQSYGLLFVQACLIYLPAIPLGDDWLSVPGMLAGSALLVLPPIAGWAVFAVTVGSTVWITVGHQVGTYAIIYSTTSAVLSSLVVFGLTWLVRVAAELDNTRRRLAQIAVAEERLRFARDLHDLLGMTLSAIALKSELTSRVLPLDRGRAADELAEILGLTRQALSDVRSVASGYRELSLESESRSAQSILQTADVRVRMEMEHADLPAPVRTVLAVVLREGVTNVLRHSNVEHCEIAVRRTPEGVSLDIVNDGVNGRPAEPAEAPAEPARLEAPSSGIRNMSERVAGLGGRLTAAVEPDGRFRLRAVVPA